MKTWAKVALTLWSLLFVTISVWFLYLVGFNPQGSSTLLALGAILLLCVGAIAIVVHSQSDLEDAERQLQTVRLTAATAVEEARKKSDSDFQALHDTSTEEIAGLKKQVERVEELLTKERETSDALRESNAFLNRRLAGLQHSVESATEGLARSISLIKSWSAIKVSGDNLKYLRMEQLGVAFILFLGLEKFTWTPEDVQPSACRDFVADMIRNPGVDITKPWVASFIRFAHRKDSDEQTDKPAEV